MSPARARPRVESVPTQRQYDPDLDAPRARSPIRLDPYFRDYQRLVTNPFLAVLFTIPWGLAFRRMVLDKNLPVTLVMLLGIAGIVCLIQFHCLDCGATGCFFRWKRHACGLCESALSATSAARASAWTE